MKPQTPNCRTRLSTIAIRLPRRGGKVRQSYVREVKGLKLTQRFRGKSHSNKKVAKADRRMRIIEEGW